MNQARSKVSKFFEGLTFKEDTHSYYVNGKRLKESVSGVIKKFVKPTDFQSIAKNIDKRDALPSGTTQRLWDYKKDISCIVGDAAHFFGEIYPFHKNLEAKTKLEEAVTKFWNDLPDHIVPVFTELRMYHKKYRFGATKDITLYNTITKKYIVGDYKTNEDLFKNFNNTKLLEPFSNFLDTPFNKYQIQLSLYQLCFEQVGPEFEVERRVIVHLKPNGQYDMYDTMDLTQTLNNYLKNNYHV